MHSINRIYLCLPHISTQLIHSTSLKPCERVERKYRKRERDTHKCQGMRITYISVEMQNKTRGKEKEKMSDEEKFSVYTFIIVEIAVRRFINYTNVLAWSASKPYRSVIPSMDICRWNCVKTVKKMFNFPFFIFDR